MKKFFLLFSFLFIGILAACSSSPDPTQPLEVALNGKKYSASFKEPVAYIIEQEAGFQEFADYNLLFPIQATGANPEMGLHINLYPGRIVVGREYELNSATDKLYLSFYPVRGHNMNEAQILSFAPKDGDQFTIRFDKIEPFVGGKVEGVLIHASMQGFYEDVLDGIIIQPDEPMNLELWNFSFTTTFQQYELFLSDSY